MRETLTEWAELTATLWHRWTVWLVVANGTGVAAVASYVIKTDAKSPNPWLLIPSGWLFLVGLTIGWIYTRRWHKISASALSYIHAYIEYDDNNIEKDSVKKIDKSALHAELTKKWDTYKSATQKTGNLANISALMFLCGVGLPLTWMTLQAFGLFTH